MTSIYPLQAILPTELVWQLSIDQYHEMIQAGILTEDDPVELLEGILVPKAPKKAPHTLTTDLTREALSGVLGVGWQVKSQDPLTTADSEPEPDVMIARGERRHYADRHPTPEEVALVVEVADSTLQRDQVTKKRLYARAGILIYWIINLIDRQIEVYTEPTGATTAPDYSRQQIYKLSDMIPVVIEGREITRLPVKDLLP